MIKCIKIENNKLLANIDGVIYSHKMVNKTNIKTINKYYFMIGKTADIQYWNIVRSASFDENNIATNVWN